jgi:DNA polymerase-1
MLVTDPSQFNQIRSELLASNLISVDTETNFTDKPQDRYCLGISLTTDSDTYYIPVAHKAGWMGTPNNVVVPTDLFMDVTCPIIAHNMKFDYQVLRKAGILLPTGNLQDTLAMSHFICEWNKGKDQGHSLEVVAPKYLGKTSQKEVRKAKAMRPNWEITPPDLMAVYAEQDARLLPELYKKLLSLMEPSWIRQWEEVDREFMLLLADLETLGLPIDRVLAEKYQTQCLERMSEIRKELGFDPAKPSQLHPKLFREPPDGLGLVPLAKTPTGKPKVDLKFLAAHSGHRVCALAYEYSKTAKQVSSYFSPYINLTTRDYARLHCDFRQYGTQTGRMSCADPNLQQIPREEYEGSSVKKVFEAEQGKQLWEIDFRTIEYRMQAVYAKDPTLLNLFRNEGDFHQLVADDVSKQSGLSISRQQAKTINYLMSFGGGVKVLNEQLGVGFSKAKQIHEAYKNSYPLIFSKAQEATDAANRNMEIPMWFGRKRHFQYPAECHKAFNAAIQGGSFEIVKRAMLKLREAGFVMSNQVHDSVWINVDNEEEVKDAQELMEGWTEKAFGLRFSTDRKRLK